MTTLDTTAKTKPCGCPELPEISRRSFLKAAGAAGVVAGLATEGMFTRLAFADTPYTGDVLVVLSFRGGMDSLQAFVPTGDPKYATLRPTIAIPQPQLLPMGGIFGMHPAMASLKPFYDAGDFGVVQAVGMADANRSHFSAMEEMERAAPGSSLRTGWLDRVLGLRDPGQPFQATQMGSNSAAAAFLGPAPELAMWSIDSFGHDAVYDSNEATRWDTGLRAIHAGAPDVVEAPALTALDALSTAGSLGSADDYVPANGASYPDSGLADALRDIARLIKGGVGLQVAAIDYGDWDMHEGEGAFSEGADGWMYGHLAELSDSLAAFATDLGSLMNGVTLASLTEFGRTTRENGSGGTDHGYGQAVMLLGGGVKGGQVHGDWPGLDEDDDLTPTTDYRNLLAEILEKRCGASSANINEIFPGIDNDRPDIVN
ncbi:MAG TPA: DUF1501 domain-containing protein, partial [Actinomycetota bacterium]